MKFPALPARIDARREVSNQRSVELAPRERSIEMLRIHARQDRPQASVDHFVSQLSRGDAPHWKQRRQPGGGEAIFPVPSHVFQKQIAKSHVGESVGDGALHGRRAAAPRRSRSCTATAGES